MRQMTEPNQPRPARFVPLAKVGDVATAHVLKARLESEGIPVRVHGFSLGPYPMTVGELAETELWVLSDSVEQASTILLDVEVNDALGVVEREDAAPASLATLGWRAVASLVAVAFLGVWLLRVFRILGLY